MTRNLRPCALAAACTLAACASYEPAPLVAADELDALRARSVVEVRADALARRDALPEPSAFDVADGLDEAELVAVALTLNPGLQAQRGEIGEAEALLVTAGVLPNPTLAASWRDGISGAPGFTAEADLLFTLLRPGERRLKREAAQSRIEEARARVGAAEWRLVGDVRLARLELWERRRALEVARTSRDLRRRLLDGVRARLEIGDASQLEATIAELELAESERAVSRAETLHATAQSTLNELVGVPASASLPLADLDASLVVRPLEARPDDALERDVVQGRPEIRELEAAYRTSEKELELAIRRQYPSIQIGPSYGREDGRDDFLGLAIGIELPLFDRNQGEIAEKEQRRRTLRDVYRSALHHAVAVARRALAQARALEAELDARSAESVPRADRLADVTTRALESRDLGVLDWIQAQRTILESRAAFLDSAVAYQRAVIEYEAATGSFGSMRAMGD
jgi:outer membrane protein TolC